MLETITDRLFAAGVVAVQLASRVAPAELPRARDGRPDVDAAAAVDPRLRSFLRGLLAGAFASKRDALAALEHLDDQRSSAWQVAAVVAAVGVAVVVGTLGVAGFANDDPPTAPPRIIVKHVEPPILSEPPKTTTPPPKTTTPPAKRIDAPPIAPPPKLLEPPGRPPSVDDALLRAIEAAVVAQRLEIEACPDDGADRVKLHLTLKQGVGALAPLARGDTDSVRCVVDAVGVAAWPKTPHQQVDADVWVWRHPSFKVAAY